MIDISKTIRISVIIPAYNASGTLEQAVASCFLQGFVDFEIIIVDNNSVDGTLELAQQLSKRYTNVSVTQEEKQGAAAARNHGARLARGEWLQFLDADDVLIEGKWPRQLALIKRGHGWLIGAFIYREKDGVESFIPVDEDPWRAIMYSGGIGHTNSNLFNREVYSKHGGMDENMPNGQDYDLFFRLLKNNENYAVDESPGCIHIRYRHLTLSTENDVRRTAMRVNLSFEIIDHLKKEKVKYWESNKKFIRSALFLHLRRQATFDLDSAYKNYQLSFPNGLSLDLRDSGIMPVSFLLFRIFGFYPVERLRNYLRKAKEATLR